MPRRNRTAYGKRATAFRSGHIPRGPAALGYSMQLPARDPYLKSRSALPDKIKAQLAGRPAEEVVSNKTSAGAENDLQ